MPGSEEQARLLEDALGVVRQQAMMMRRCLETPGKLMDALKCWCVLPIKSRRTVKANVNIDSGGGTGC